MATVWIINIWAYPRRYAISSSAECRYCYRYWVRRSSCFFDRRCGSDAWRYCIGTSTLPRRTAMSNLAVYLWVLDYLIWEINVHVGLNYMHGYWTTNNIHENDSKMWFLNYWKLLTKFPNQIHSHDTSSLDEELLMMWIRLKSRSHWRCLVHHQSQCHCHISLILIL